MGVSDERKIRRLPGRRRPAARLPEPDHPRPHGGARGPPGLPRLPAVRQQRGLRLPGEVQRHQDHLQVLRAQVRRPGQGRLDGSPGVRGARDAAPVRPDRVAAPRDQAAGLQPRHQRGAGGRVLRRRGVQPGDRACHPAPRRPAPLPAADRAGFLPGHPARPDGGRDRRRFRRRLRLPRHGHGQAQEGPPHRVRRRRRTGLAAGPLAGTAADVAGPAGLAARRRDAGQLPFRGRDGRRSDRPGADEARRPDVRRRAGHGRTAARVHARLGRPAPCGPVHRALPTGVQRPLP